MDLLKKAQRWDDKNLTQLKQEKDKVSEELREAMKKSRKESELNTVEQQIHGLETRHKYAKGDLDTTVSPYSIILAFSIWKQTTPRMEFCILASLDQINSDPSNESGGNSPGIGESERECDLISIKLLRIQFFLF